MRTRAALLGAALVVSFALAACGGDDGGGSSPLVGTPLPTATALPPTPVTCQPEPILDLPPQMPQDIRMPPDYNVYEVDQGERELYIRGRVVPPSDERLSPEEMLEAALLDNMSAEWTFTPLVVIGEKTYRFNHMSDGREGQFRAQNVEGCEGYADLTWRFYWVTAESAGG